jgi:hypothetical protein
MWDRCYIVGASVLDNNIGEGGTCAADSVDCKVLSELSMYTSLLRSYLHLMFNRRRLLDHLRLCYLL